MTISKSFTNAIIRAVALFAVVIYLSPFIALVKMFRDSVKR